MQPVLIEILLSYRLVQAEDHQQRSLCRLCCQSDLQPSVPSTFWLTDECVEPVWFHLKQIFVLTCFLNRVFLLITFPSLLPDLKKGNL